MINLINFVRGLKMYTSWLHDFKPLIFLIPKPSRTPKKETLPLKVIPKPSRMSVEMEDIILRKTLTMSLDSRENNTGIVYLEITATKTLKEGKMLNLSQELMERVVINQLSERLLTAEPPS